MAGNAPGDAPATSPAAIPRALRILGALAVLVVGVVHLQQYFAVYYRVIPVIGPLFLLNFIAATAIGLVLLAPVERLGEKRRPGAGRITGAVLALGGIGLAALSFVFLLISENGRLFGFAETGYRSAMYIALVAEAAAVLLLVGYIAIGRRPSRNS